MGKHIHPEEGMVYACPACDTATPFERTSQRVRIGAPERFACYTCSAVFDEPVERPMRTRKPDGVERLRTIFGEDDNGE